ncbi:MAG: nickel-type superoxide dismutase maturation protease [Chloroflexi bacterium]|nr:MAG: nickel-type superoxide dismutase maturation protease [Chloroflexota bacterium]
MNRKTRRLLIRLASRLPGLYPLLAFITGRRVIVLGSSMAPTLLPGDRLVFDRLAYLLRPPAVGEVVLARHQARPGLRMIKRVARKGPEGYCLLGDNHDGSTDSRQLGPFRRRDILGRGWLVYWPPERFRRL